MAFLYTLLGIILFIIVLFLVPVRVTAHYEDIFEMTVQYGLIKIKLFPQKEKSEKKRQLKGFMGKHQVDQYSHNRGAGGEERNEQKAYLKMQRLKASLTWGWK